jgi:hypothetical protein
MLFFVQLIGILLGVLVVKMYFCLLQNYLEKMFKSINATSLTDNKFYHLFILVLKWIQIYLYHWHGDIENQEEAFLFIIFVLVVALL